MLHEKLIEHIKSYDQLMSDLHLVRELGLPNCYIAAGYIRNFVWDRQHGYASTGRHSDIDVVYYDATNCTKAIDIALENDLIRQTGNQKWSVKNQARMHIRNENAPYTSIEDALSRWPETATSVGAQLDSNDNIQLIFPHGLEDLFQMIVRRSPLFTDKNYYMNRIGRKNWKAQWPLITVVNE